MPDKKLTLYLDIETAPNVAHVWGLFKQNISTNQIVDAGYVMCASYKWGGDDTVTFVRFPRKNPKPALTKLRDVLSKAEVVVHYNGNKFDVPTLNKEFLTHGITPPAPAKQIDLYDVAKRRFRFASHKLDFIAQQLGTGKKVRHAGHVLWIQCMAGDKDAWRDMEQYNKQDVVLLERLHERMLPWITDTISHGESCPHCGGSELRSNGYRRTATMRYQRLQCYDCGGWIRRTVGGERVSTLRGIV